MIVVLIDGRNSMFRFGWVGRNLSSASGVDTGALHGLLGGMQALKRRFPTCRFVVCWDGKRNYDGWRAKIFPGYKANRRPESITAEQQAVRAKISAQIGNVKKLLTLIGVSQIEIPELEADDVVGVLSDKLISSGHQSYIFSNDQDYFQMVARGAKILYATGQPFIEEKHIRYKFRCSAADVLKVRALIGDKSDGIPRAVPGVGPISAAKYVEAGIDPSVSSFADLPRTARENAARIERYWSTVHLNWRLMRILSSCSDHELDPALSARFSLETRRVLKELRASIQHKKSDYELFLKMLAELDMREALSERHNIWHLQTIVV